MMASNTNIKGPLAYLLAGTMLIFIPAAFHMINYTFFGTPNILSYTGSGETALSQQSIVTVIGLVQVIGLIAFVRGWMHIARLAEQGGGQPMVGKALTHIIAGVFAINVVQLKDVIWYTFGFS
jgi:intracellular multiplication protein IcmC